MTPLNRHPDESTARALRRVAIFAVGLLLLAGGWRLVRHSLLKSLARWNIGPAECAKLIDQAVIECNPGLSWQRNDEWLGAGWFWQTHSYDSGRTRTVVAFAEGGEFGKRSTWRILDQDFRVVTSFNAQQPQLIPLDDRNNDGTLEAVFLMWTPLRAAGGNEQYWAIVRFGESRHTLIAIVRESVASTTAPAPPSFSMPTWTDANADGLHELEWLDYSSAASGAWMPVKTVLTLRWLSAGRMAVDGPLPAGYRIWLPENADEGFFGIEEDIQSVVERVFPSQ